MMMQTLIEKARDEVAFVWMTVLVIVNALQTQAVDLPRGVHIAIAVITSVLAAWGIRANVTPTSKLEDR